MNKNSITTALATLALLLGTGAGLSSCADEVDTLDPARNSHTAGQLGIVSLSSDGVALVADPTRTASSRTTNDDGTTAATANRAIRSFAANDAVVTRYRFIDIATTPAPEASMHTCAATAEGLGTAASPLLWKMGKRDANTNPLAPGKDKNPAETWDEARMEITYAAIGTASATPTDPNYGTIVPPTGTDGDAASNRSHMAYHKSSTTIGDAPAVVHQYFDALVASNLATATASLPGTKPATLDPGALYIERTKGKEQGAVSANLAHRGALLRLTADKTSISGFAEGFDRLTVLLAKATIKAGAAGSQQEEEVYIRFSKVDIAGGAPTEPTRTASAAVWQAIVPDGAVVSQFIATIATADAPTATNPQATYYIALPTATPALTANTSYPLSLTLTPDTQTLSVGNAPALPGWPNDELEWTNTQNASYTESGGVRTYTVYNVKGLMEVIDYINGTNNSGTNAAGVNVNHKNTNVTLNAGTTYDLTEVYKSAADGTKPAYTPIGNSSSSSYTGVFDGKGATIKGLYINDTSANIPNSGLFGRISDCTVKDVHLTNVSITIAQSKTDASYIGGIAGYSIGTVTGCTVSGNITSTENNAANSCLGGVVGSSNNSALVENCTSNVTINSTSTYTGGVVGNNNNCVMGCTATGNTTSTSTNNTQEIYIGGVVGYNNNYVMGCTATGDVIGNNTKIFIGGVVGFNYSYAVIGCASTGNVSCTVSNSSTYTGGVIGYNEGDAFFCACYATGAVSNAGSGSCYGVAYFSKTSTKVITNYWVQPASPASTATLAGPSGSTATQAEKLTDIAALNDQTKVDKLNNIIFKWNNSANTDKCNYKFELGMGENKTPTIVAGAPDKEILIPNASYTESGDKRTYTEVLNAKGIMEVIDYINGTDHSGKNTANIGNMHLNTDVTLNAGTTYDLSEVYKASADDTSKPDFLPIGTKADGTADPYTGTFDGKGATITGLYIAVSRSYNGLFAKNYGTVTNIKLTKVNISSTERMTINIGGIAGQNGESGTLGSVTNCTVEGELAGISYSTIRLGGVVGYNNYGDVMGCTSNVTLTDTGSNANSYIGGVVGYNNRGNVMGCTAAGTVSNNTPGGTSYAGGVVGYNEYGSIVACISTANVNNKSTNRTYAYTGGVAGYSTGSSIYACYNTGAVYGAVTAKTHGVTWNEGRFYVKAAYWMKPSSPESNATDVINTAGYEEYVEKLKDISSLNDKVDAAKNQGGLNLYIKAWNTDYPEKLCNYKFKAGNNARTPPTIVAGRPQ